MPLGSLFLMLAGISLFTGVAMGAFGAHALRESLSPAMMEIYQTAVNYQMWHGLGIGLIALLAAQVESSGVLRWAGWLMFAGILLFSGSLYLFTVCGLKWLRLVTPFGGTAFLAAWLLVIVYAHQSNRDRSHA